MSSASDFAKLQALVPTEAVAYMAGRQPLKQTYNAYELWRSEHERAFTVSRLARADLLQAIQASITKSVAGDLTRRDWINETEKLLQAAGWWGKKSVVDPSTGEVLTTNFNHARLQLMFDTNTRQAWAAGQWQRLQRNQRTMPYARYVSKDDDRVRPQHRAWHNVTLPVSDPWWDTHRPPNGYRCRCRFVGVTQKEYDQGTVSTRPGAESDTSSDSNAPLVQESMIKTAPPEAMMDWLNPSTGKVQKIAAGIDPGFDYNPGTIGRSEAFDAVVQAKLARLSPEVASAARAAGITLPAIAKELPDQANWQTKGLADLRAMTPAMTAPDLLPKAASVDDAVQTLRDVLGIEAGEARLVQTPAGVVTMFDKLLKHVVEKRLDGRERYANFILPTLEEPDEIWQTAYNDDTTRRRYIKLFKDAKYDLMVIVREGANGDVLWNVLNRDRKDMNTLRTGQLIHRAER